MVSTTTSNVLNRKLYDLTAPEIARLNVLGYKARGIGYVNPEGKMASNDEIFSVLATSPGSTTTDKYIFSELLKQAERRKVIPNKTKAARDWFRVRAQDAGKLNNQGFFKNTTLTNTPLPGRMYMFTYDAKHKDTLPFWDAFPLIFPVGRTKGGFTGINLHYLPPLLRARLMDSLYTIANNKKFDDTTKLNISYNTLRSASSMTYFKPCFKQYLFSQVKSRFIYIEPKEWDIALMLPCQSFKKASATQVWKESQNVI